jgi:hypothetical protein
MTTTSTAHQHDQHQEQHHLEPKTGSSHPPHHRRRRSRVTIMSFLVVVLLLFLILTVNSSKTMKSVNLYALAYSTMRGPGEESSQASMSIISPLRNASNFTNSTTYGPCLNALPPSGFGNLMYVLLHALLKAKNDQTQQPCVKSHGDLFGTLFVNVESCPEDQPTSSCQELSPHPPWTEISDFIEKKKASAHSLFELNATFIRDNLFHNLLQNTQLGTIQGLQQSLCAVHARFGDSIMLRNTTEKYDRRLCKGTSNQNPQSCYSRLANRIRRKCRNNAGAAIGSPAGSTMYLASDNPAFVRYFLSHPMPNETLLTSANGGKSNDEKHHIFHSADNATLLENLKDGPFRSLLIDWTVLALSKSRAVLSHSSFSESASLGFTVQIPTSY